MNSKLRRYVSKSYNRYVKRGISGITASSRVLPDFIIVGTVRSGSTSLYYNICEHPSVLSAAYDEIGFFADFAPFKNLNSAIDAERKLKTIIIG